MRTSLLVLLVFLVPLLSTAQPDWTEHTVDQDFDGVFSIHAADIDSDGDLDLLGAANLASSIAWWENSNGNGLDWAEHTVDASLWGARGVNSADIDGDGDLDVLAVGWYDDAVVWWENLDGGGLNWAEHAVTLAFNGAYCVIAVDVDGDDDLDMLGAASHADDILWWENLDGDGLNWSEHIVDDAFNGARGVFAADIDGDNDLDVLGSAYTDNDITWWENLNGDGLSWSEHTVDGEYAGAWGLYASDMDGDGDLDVLGSAYETGDVTWWENLDGDGLSWSEHTLTVSFDGASSVCSADVDGDGDQDVFGSSAGNGVIWWENLDGDGLNWSEHAIGGDIFVSYDVHVADVDGDNDQDVLGSDYHEGDIMWWEQPGAPVLLVTSPNGGENWSTGTTQTIEWIPNLPGDVSIELLQNDVFELEISATTENDGSFEWTLPSDLDTGDDFKVRVSLLTGEESDESNSPFIISSSPTLTITPHDPPIVIDPEGDGFWYWLEIENPTPYEGTGQYWNEVVLPSGNTYGPIIVNVFSIGSFSSYAPGEPLGQWVPAYAPAGTYQYVLHAGSYPSLIVATDSFEFVKLAGTSPASRLDCEWNVEDWRKESWDHSATLMDGKKSIPTEFSVSHAYPNPFNPTTTVFVALSQAVELTVNVYNVSGQQVAELAHGLHQAGWHKFAFDASGLASGLYFVRANVPGRFDQIQKVVLVR